MFLLKCNGILLNKNDRGLYVCSVRKFVVCVILTLRLGPGDVERVVPGDVDSLTMCQRRGQTEQGTMTMSQ